MENSSLKIKFENLKDYALGGVVLKDELFWKIKIIDHSTFTATHEGDSFIGFNKFLQPYGKEGTINQFNGKAPFFKYSENKLRKDTPKEVVDGTLYSKIETGTLGGLLKANLTGSIVQLGKGSKDGGVVINDGGYTVTIKLKTGKLKLVKKENLHYNKLYYTKSRYKRLWFIHDHTKFLSHSLPIITSKGNRVKEYIELYNSLDKGYEKSTDYRVYSKNSMINLKLTNLWNIMNPKEKEKVSKKI